MLLASNGKTTKQFARLIIDVSTGEVQSSDVFTDNSAPLELKATYIQDIDNVYAVLYGTFNAVTASVVLAQPYYFGAAPTVSFQAVLPSINTDPNSVMNCRLLSRDHFIIGSYSTTNFAKDPSASIITVPLMNQVIIYSSLQFESCLTNYPVSL